MFWYFDICFTNDSCPIRIIRMIIQLMMYLVGSSVGHSIDKFYRFTGRNTEQNTFFIHESEF